MGLENNELCVWIASEPLSVKEVKEAMRKAVPDFAQYLKRGQIEIIPHTEWYLKAGAFNGGKTLNAWTYKLNQALAKGYDGMRVTGNTTWLEKEDWGDFTDYEEEISSVIGDYRMLAICAYSSGKCGVDEIMDVMRNHQFVLIKRAGRWVLIEGSGHKWAEENQETAVPATSKRRLTLLQERFVRLGFEGFSDRETIELFLSLTLSSYRECQKLAKKCLAEFKNFSGFLAASPQELERVGITPQFVFCIKLLRELPTELLKKEIIERSFYKSSKEVFNYLYYSMRDLKKEVFKAIYLNSRNQIIETEDLFEGTLESIPIRPREIVDSAIRHGSTAVIFVHNHPSGSTTPSQSDKQLTRDLVFIGSIIQVKVLDHIIIGGNEYYSFADEGLIQKYEDSFLNLRIKGVFDSGAVHRRYLRKVSTLHTN